MKFELKPTGRHSSDEELIKDLIEVAQKLGKKSLTRDEYSKHGKYGRGTIEWRFGWLNALKKAGLSTSKSYNVTDEELLDEMRRIAKLPNVGNLTRDIFNEHKQLSSTWAIENRFGSWTKALKKAGLHVSPTQIKKYSDEELFENLLNVWTHLGKQPTSGDLGDYPSKINRNTYSDRFGSWRNALEAFVKYTNKGQAEAFNEVIEKEQISPVETKASDDKRIQHKTSRTINVRLRFLTMKRDNFKCKNCGRSPATEHSVILHVDHIYPWSKGGETIIENLQTLCSKCNYGKSNL